MKNKPRGFVIWEGLSWIDRKTPIVMIATIESKNSKTGNMIQIWYLVAGEHPVEAIQNGNDEAICGDCPLRPFHLNVCYLEIGKAPAAVWRGYKRGIYPKLDLRRTAHRKLLFGRMVRDGAYGDPGVAPLDQVRRVMKVTDGGTGYSHQILPLLMKGKTRRAAKLAERCMVSVDNPAALKRARAAGLRSFIVVSKSGTPPEGAVECLNQRDGTLCVDCLECDGTDPNEPKPDIWVWSHGIGSVNHKSFSV